jgi:hypothetical protein
MTVEDAFPEHIAPFGIMNSGWGVKILNYMVGIYKNYAIVPAIKYQV